jgi:hypothetical protein
MSGVRCLEIVARTRTMFFSTGNSGGTWGPEKNRLATTSAECPCLIKAGREGLGPEKSHQFS